MRSEPDYTMRDLMNEFNISYGVIRTMLENGTLCGYKLNRQWRVPASEVRAYKQRNAAQVQDIQVPRISHASNQPRGYVYKQGDKAVDYREAIAKLRKGGNNSC